MINYVVGDATAPEGDGTKIITHCCNNRGGFGAGFVVALAKKYPVAKEAYLSWFNGQATTKEPFDLGKIQIVTVEPELFVCNLIGQDGTSFINGQPPIRYLAIRSGLKALATRILAKERITGKKPSVHMPRMGAGLAGGSWDLIEEIINEELIAQGIEVTVYDLPEKE